MKLTGRLSTRLMLSNLMVLLTGALAFTITFRLLASEIFDDRLRRRGAGGPPSSGEGLINAFNDSVNISLFVSLGVGVIAAGVVAWVVANRMTVPLERIGESTRAIAAGDYGERVGATDIVELNALADDVNQLAGKLEATEQRRARLLSDVSHELRTPLTSIDGFAEGVVDGVFTAEEMHQAITEETGRLLRLIEDLSLLSKTTEHALALDAETLLLTEVAQTAVEQLRPSYIERSVDVAVEVQSDSTVFGDRTRLVQVMMNLLTNALGHVADGGSVRVVLSTEDGNATAVVVDDGDGIAAEDLDRVFDRFFRGRDANKRQGSGLGLAVARGIAEAHDGTLTVSSEGIGLGSTFTLHLPVTAI